MSKHMLSGRRSCLVLLFYTHPGIHRLPVQVPVGNQDQNVGAILQDCDHRQLQKLQATEASVKHHQKGQVNGQPLQHSLDGETGQLRGDQSPKQSE